MKKFFFDFLGFWGLIAAPIFRADGLLFSGSPEAWQMLHWNLIGTCTIDVPSRGQNYNRFFFINRCWCARFIPFYLCYFYICIFVKNGLIQSFAFGGIDWIGYSETQRTSLWFWYGILQHREELSLGFTETKFVYQNKFSNNNSSLVFSVYYTTGCQLCFSTREKINKS